LGNGSPRRTKGRLFCAALNERGAGLRLSDGNPVLHRPIVIIRGYWSSHGNAQDRRFGFSMRWPRWSVWKTLSAVVSLFRRTVAFPTVIGALSLPIVEGRGIGKNAQVSKQGKAIVGSAEV
jgi:hypothetical protein